MSSYDEWLQRVLISALSWYSTYGFEFNNREFTIEAVLYDQNLKKYNILEIDVRTGGKIEIIDKLQGWTLTEKMLLERLKRAESVDTIPYRDLVPNGKSLEEFEEELVDVSDIIE